MRLHADETALQIAGQAGNLEAILSRPDGAADDALYILCHPHPLHQGSMHNKVITTMARAARACRVSSLRFNYRGVGQSEGTYQTIPEAVDDATSIYQWAKQQGFSITGWMGFSFGAYVAANLANQTQPEHGALLIAPSIDNMPYATLTPNPKMHWHIVQGQDDDVVNPQATHAWAQHHPHVQLTTYSDVGHFFHGKLEYIDRAACALILGHAS